MERAEAAYPEVAIPLEGFAEVLREGERVLLDDGRVVLRVLEGKRGAARCIAEVEGDLRDRIGVHLPAHSVRVETFTDKDRADLTFGLSQDVDYVAVSFVRSADDLRRVRAFCEERGKRVPLVAKIETPQAVEHIDAILEASDAVMVARGDLGVEFVPEKVPVLQRLIISRAHAARKPVIVATEMLQSMVHSKRPTRAEASDVAHAVFEGADAVMLSAETATGDHPDLAVGMMARIVLEAEASVRAGEGRPGTAHRESIAESIAFNAADIAEEVGATALVAFTFSGNTARLVASARPNVPIVVLSPSAQTCRRLALVWGVSSLQVGEVGHSDRMIELAIKKLIDEKLLSIGDRFVAVFGAPTQLAPETNSISVRVAG